MKHLSAPVLAGIIFAATSLAVFGQATSPSSGAASQNPASPSATAAQTTAAQAPAADPLADFGGASPACRTALQKASDLKAAGKWRSAFDALTAYDPANADPYALAMKARLCMDGYVATEQYQSFALKDLADGETVDALRASGSDAPPISFDPPALAAAIASKGGALPAILSRVLGDYYYNAQIEFSGHWVMSDQDAYQKALDQYQAAYAGGSFDGDSLQNLGELLVRFDRPAEAVPIFQKSLALNPSNPTARYNYAVCLIRQGDRNGALDQLDQALALFADPQAKFETLNLAAHTAVDAGDAARTESYLKKAETLVPQGPDAGLLRHEIAVRQKNPTAANAAADALMAQFSSNPAVVRTLISVWYSNGDAASALAFLNRSIAGTKDDMSLGTLQFYLAILLAQGNPSDADKTAALAALDQSVAHMKKVMSPDDQFFSVAEQVRDHIAPPASTPASPAPASPAPQTAAPASPTP